MPQDALTDQNTIAWRTEELSTVFGAKAGEGLQAQIDLPPVPEEDPKPYISRDAELGGAVELTERGIQALMSGNYGNLGANTFYRENDHQSEGHNKDDDEKRLRKNQANMRILQNSFSDFEFNFNGLNLSGEEASTYLDAAAKRISKEQTANTSAARLDITTEELKIASKMDGCAIVDGRPIEEIAIVDGYVVDTELYYQAEIQNQTLIEQQQQIQQFTVQLEAGDVTWEQVPDDIATLIVNEHEIQENGIEPEILELAQDPQTILEQLNALNAESPTPVAVQPLAPAPSF